MYCSVGAEAERLALASACASSTRRSAPSSSSAVSSRLAVSRHVHSQKSPFREVTHVGPEILGLCERPELMYPGLRANSKRQLDEDAIAHRWAIDFYLAGRIKNGHS